jgi:hypothetical protein
LDRTAPKACADFDGGGAAAFAGRRAPIAGRDFFSRPAVNRFSSRARAY